MVESVRNISFQTPQTQAVQPAQTTKTVQPVQPAASVQKADSKESTDVKTSKQMEINPANSEKKASQAQIRQAVEKLNRSMGNAEAIFGIHEETNRVTIKIIDRSTKEVIKELPPEKTLDMIAKVWELAGILVDEKR